MESNGSAALPSRSSYDWSVTPPSLAVIDAVAAVEGMEPMQFSQSLETTLFDHVDPEALDVIVTGGEEVSITFEIGEYAVDIAGNEVTIHHS